uniref:Uncharacterized protein n=1 Tax=viral metagenome TaxID=1070528 RepID=A0A6C0DKQ3_9ZZZZ
MALGVISQGLGGLKEYIYRGLQQLPIVLASTSLVYTVSTGSLAHLNIFLGMAFLVPVVTFLLQQFIGWGIGKIWPNSVFWKRGGGDTCNMLPSLKQESLTYFDKNALVGGSVPSYWLMQVSFFIGYCISNALDSLLTPPAQGSSAINHEKRNTHAVLVIITTVIFSLLVLGMRFYFMTACEGSSNAGLIISCIAALGAAGIGYGMYDFSKKCGARSSDLFGVLSQILPPSATSPHPIVCSAS